PRTEGHDCGAAASQGLNLGRVESPAPFLFGTRRWGDGGNPGRSASLIYMDHPVSNQGKAHPSRYIIGSSPAISKGYPSWTVSRWRSSRATPIPRSPWILPGT